MQPRAHGNSKRFVEDHPGQGDVGRIKPERHDTGTGGFESQKTLTPSICRSSSAKTCASPKGAVALATADPTKRIPAANPAMPGRLMVPASSRQGYSVGCSGLSERKPVPPSRNACTGKGADKTSTPVPIGP